MLNFFGFLLAAAWPLAKKVLMMLGIGWLTYEGLALIGQQVVQEVTALWGQVSGDTLRLASLCGLPQGIGIILGAVMAKIAMATVGKLGKLTS